MINLDYPALPAAAPRAALTPLAAASDDIALAQGEEAPPLKRLLAVQQEVHPALRLIQRMRRHRPPCDQCLQPGHCRLPALRAPPRQ